MNSLTTIPLRWKVGNLIEQELLVEINFFRERNYFIWNHKMIIN